jgi:tripartite-type tricarboxylate transporter receptor subunit TctC
MVGAVPIVLLVNAGLKVDTIADLIAYGKANPGKLAFGSSGVGGTGHLAGEAFNAATKLNAVHVPYKGDAPAAVDVMGGQVQMAFIGIASATTPLQSGKVKAIAVFHKNRISSIPDVPTVAEAGYKGMEFAAWYALYARSGTPRPVIDQLNRAVKYVLERDDVRAGMAGQGAEVIYSTPEGLAKFSQAEIQRLGDIIRRLGVKGQ